MEYTSPDETAVCNLASIALPRFVREQNPSGREGRKLVGSLDAESRFAGGGCVWHGSCTVGLGDGWVEPSHAHAAALSHTHLLTTLYLLHPLAAGTLTLRSCTRWCRW